MFFSFVECDLWTFGIGCNQSCSCNGTNTQKYVMDFLDFTVTKASKQS